MLESHGLCVKTPSADFLNLFYSDCSLQEQPSKDISNIISRLSPTSEAKTFNELLGLLQIKGHFVEDCKKFVSTSIQEQKKEDASNDMGCFNEKQIHRTPELSKNKICFLIEEHKIPYWIEISNWACGKPKVIRNALAYK